MFRTLFTLFFLLGTFAADAQIRGEFTIAGDLTPVVELWGSEVDSLRFVLLRGRERIEPQESAGGRFRFAGTIDSRYVETAYLQAATPQSAPQQIELTLLVFLEPGAIRVWCRPMPEEEVFDVVVEGTPSNELLYRRMSRYADMNYEMLALGRDTTLSYAVKSEALERMLSEQDSLRRYLYRDFSDSPVAPMLAIQQFYGTNDFRQAGEALALLCEKFPDHPDLRDLGGVWLGMPGLGVGDLVPDVSALDRRGRPIRLGEIRPDGYLLLDFWFSADGMDSPREFPPVYNGLPLKRVGISTDPSRAVWLRNLRRHPADLQLWDEGHAVSRAFHLTAYPARFLIDPRGRIVARGDFTTLPPASFDQPAE